MSNWKAVILGLWKKEPMTSVSWAGAAPSTNPEVRSLISEVESLSCGAWTGKGSG